MEITQAQVGSTSTRFADQSPLDYLNARYYDHARGQFISQDPVFWSVRQNLTDPQSLNSYSYANDNPVTKKDPDGQAASLAGFISSLQSFVASLQSFINSLFSGGVSSGSGGGSQSKSNGVGGGSSSGSASVSGVGGSGGLPNSGGPVNYQTYNQSYAAIELSLYKDKVKYVTGGNGPDAQCGGGVDCSGAIIYGIRKVANPNFPDMDAQQLHDKFSGPVGWGNRVSGTF